MDACRFLIHKNPTRTPCFLKAMGSYFHMFWECSPVAGFWKSIASDLSKIFEMKLPCYRDPNQKTSSRPSGPNIRSPFMHGCWHTWTLHTSEPGLYVWGVNNYFVCIFICCLFLFTYLFFLSVDTKYLFFSCGSWHLHSSKTRPFSVFCELVPFNRVKIWSQKKRRRAPCDITKGTACFWIVEHMLQNIIFYRRWDICRAFPQRFKYKTDDSLLIFQLPALDCIWSGTSADTKHLQRL